MYKKRKGITLFNRFEITVALRYLKAKHKNSFVSFISLVSIAGITLGVAALITVLSVMNGFQHEIRSKIIGISAHMQLMDASGMLMNWSDIADKAKQSNQHILKYAPYVDGRALISFDNNVSGVLVRGIDPIFENTVNDINKYIVKGDDNTLISGKFNVMIGSSLASQLGVKIGDKITLITPDGQITIAEMTPHLQQFTISGIFNFHMGEYDSRLILINLKDSQALFKMGAAISGVRLKVDDMSETPKIKAILSKVLPDNIISTDWIDQNQSYFAAVEMEKKMMFIILTLIIAVAAFNLVSTLVMTVNDKKTDIAILCTMGASKRNIMSIFMIQGCLSGIIGTLSGTILGLMLSTYIGQIVHFFESITGTQLINASVYNIDFLPSQINSHDVIGIIMVSIILSILATLYPSMNAAKTNPVEALRYE